MAEQNTPRELNWDTELDENATAFRMIPHETECFFGIVSMKRASGSYGKLGECNAAELELMCRTEDGTEATIPVLLPLHPKMEWKLVEFAKSIGHFPKIRWSELEGVTGRCLVGVRKWKKREDPDDKAKWTGESNEVLKFLPAAADAIQF